MNSKREECAIDALLVSQLRSNRTDVESLPELNEEEQEVLGTLGDDFVERLLAGDLTEVCDAPEDVEPEATLCGPAFGLNRAKDIDEETKIELDRKRKEIIDRLKEDDGAHDDADNSK